MQENIKIPPFLPPIFLYPSTLSGMPLRLDTHGDLSPRLRIPSKVQKPPLRPRIRSSSCRAGKSSNPSSLSRFSLFCGIKNEAGYTVSQHEPLKILTHPLQVILCLSCLQEDWRRKLIWVQTEGLWRCTRAQEEQVDNRRTKSPALIF